MKNPTDLVRINLSFASVILSQLATFYRFTFQKYSQLNLYEFADIGIVESRIEA